MDDDELLARFFGSYFHQDFDVDAGTEEKAVEMFVAGSPSRVGATIAALERSARLSEDVLAARVQKWAGSDAVRAENYASYSAWLTSLAAQMLRVVRAGNAGGVVCPDCRQDWLMRVRVLRLDREVVLCGECESLWASADLIGTGESDCYRAFMGRHGSPDPRPEEIEILGRLGSNAGRES